ncbi:MAG: CvpA family protein [Clostridia bacterium]|nr:CvpA family protein [Clostridia bacterium]
MISLIITALVVLIVLANALLGLRRGTFRSVVRLCMLLVSIPLAVWLTRLLGGALGKLISPMILNILQNAGAEITDALTELTHAIGALASMVAAAAIFTGVYLFVALLTKLADKPLAALLDKKFKPKVSSRLMGTLLGSVGGIVLAVAVLCPVTGLLPVASSVVALTDQESTPLGTELQDAADSPVRVVLSALGGDVVFSALTTVEYEEERVDLKTETTALTDLISGYVLLSEKQSTAWGTEEAEQLDRAADAFDASRITADFAAAVLSDLSLAWSRGASYMGMEMPSMGELLDPSMVTLFEALSDSTGNSIRQNVHTVSDVIGAMIQYDVFRTAENSAADAALDEQTNLTVLTLFSDAAFTGSVVEALYHDEQLRVLIPEILNLGVRAVAFSLGVPDSYPTLYYNMMESCSDAFNQTAAQNDVNRMVTLGDALHTILNESGVNVSPSTAMAMAMGMIADYGDRSSVTADDITAWFASYAGSAAIAADQISTRKNSSVQPLGAAEGSPSLILLVDTAPAAPMAGAQAAAEYISTLQNAPTPYQIVTFFNTETDDICTVVSMSDGSLRAFDSDGQALDLDALDIGTLGALVGGELAAIRCKAPWEIATAPRRIDPTQLSALSSQLLAATSPLPDGYVPTGSVSAISSSSLQNAQNIPADITDLDSLLCALSTAANHELVRGTYSTGSVNTMTDADSFVSSLPCLNTMTLSDVGAICEGMSEESAGSVGTALASLATYLSADGAQADPIGSLFGSEGADAVSALLDSLTLLSGDNTAAINTLLAGTGYCGGDISALRTLLEKDDLSVSSVANQLLTTSGVFSTLTTATDPEAQIDAVERVLSNLDEQGARAIAAAITPSMLETFGLPHTLSSSFSSMIRSAFETLADAKKNGMTDEQFRREADALSALFAMGTNIANSDRSGTLFGADGLLGKDAATLLDTILNSNIISGALIDMVGGTGGAHFTVANVNPMTLSTISDSDREQLLAAIARAEQTLTQLPASNGELWTPQNNQITQQDTARRLISFAALFGLEYTSDYANIPQ